MLEKHSRQDPLQLLVEALPPLLLMYGLYRFSKSHNIQSAIAETTVVSLILCAVLVALILAYQYWKRHEQQKYGMDKIDVMTGFAFQDYLANLFRELGYHITKTPHRADYGCDFIIARDGKKAVVQAKRSSDVISIKAVQEAIAAKEYYRTDYAAVITNNRFSSNALRIAEKTGVILISRENLLNRIKKAYNQKA
ncbi:MAG TPA: restriction endonuclease [bacterium]|nr:restriction endonuclease [bacterium]